MSERPFNVSEHAQRVPRFVLTGLFVLADGWNLVVGSLVKSFH